MRFPGSVASPRQAAGKRHGQQPPSNNTGKGLRGYCTQRPSSRVISRWEVTFLYTTDRSELFMELYREEKKEEGDRGGQEDKRGE